MARELQSSVKVSCSHSCGAAHRGGSTRRAAASREGSRRAELALEKAAAEQHRGGVTGRQRRSLGRREGSRPERERAAAVMASSVSTSPSSVHLLPRLLRCLQVTPPRSFSAATFSKASSGLLLPSLLAASRRVDPPRCAGPQLCEHETLTLDWSSLAIGEARADDELRAAVRLRVRSFYEFSESYNVEGHKEYVVEREFKALKERISGKRIGFRRVACINATLPLSQSMSPADDLCEACKFSDKGEQRIVVGTLDLNQCLWLADELTGMRPEVLLIYMFMLLWTMKLQGSYMRKMVSYMKMKSLPGKPGFLVDLDDFFFGLI